MVLTNRVDAETIILALGVAASYSDVADGMLVGVLLLSVVIGVATGVVVAALATNILAGAMIDLGFDISELSKGLCCWSAFDCWPLAALDFARVLQAWMPSCHVCSSLALPALPQLPNQDPPRAQQLLFPDFWMEPHVGHSKLMIAALSAGVCVHIWALMSQMNIAKTLSALSQREDLRLQAAAPSDHV